LIQDAAGNLYGTTCFAGQAGGTVFKVDASGNETVLYSFAGGADGACPVGGLVQDPSGNLYGTTIFGGDCCGTVFKLDPTGKETVLHIFTGGGDGLTPYAGLVRDQAGNLYGTTYIGGDSPNCVPGGCGTVFKLDASGKETVLYSFTDGADGAFPYAALILDAEGNLYGTTYGGGSMSCYLGCGTVFKLDTNGTETVLHCFTGGEDGEYPEGGLIRDPAGNLYGTTYGGGIYGLGTVFELDTSGTETVLHTFTGKLDGGYSSAGVIRDSRGNFYGTTQFGGAYGHGAVFGLRP
jgi:uncharacterized repeat protein (TIGR03803 family)